MQKKRERFKFWNFYFSRFATYIKTFKSDIVKQRKNLPPETRRNSKVKYHPTWPCFSKQPEPINNKPTDTKEAVVKSYLDHTKITLQ